MDLTIDHLQETDLLKNSEAGKLQVKALVKTLSALSRVRFQLQPDRSKYTYIASNPFGIYTLKDLSIDLSEAGYDHLLSEQLRDQRSTVQLLEVGGSLRRGMDLGERTGEACSSAIDAIKDYFAVESFLTKNDLQGAGYVFHDIYESLVYRYLESKDVESDFEVEISPPRKFRIDTLIEVDANFKMIIEKQFKIKIPDGIKQISIDYTLSSDKEIIKGKCFKSYQSDDRFLLIVLLGDKKASKITALQNLVDNLKTSEELYLEHVNVITAKDLMDFLSVDGYFKKINEQINYLSFNLFDNQYLNKFTTDIWRYSREYLAMVRGEQLIDVF